MSWIGDSFNSLTGQITNFTREVLNEGTEETSDHVAELNVSKSQVQDLTNQCQALRTEVERLRSLNVELEEKSQSAELQSYAISNEYRTLLEQKETELKVLKQQQSDVPKTHGEHVSAPSPDRSNDAHLFDFDNQSGVVDFDDVIGNQHEIGKLPDLNQRSPLEGIGPTSSNGYQGKASVQGSSHETKSLNEFQEQIKELRSQLHFEVDQHQDELTALQDFHQQKYAKIKEQYENEVAELQSKISVLQSESDDVSSSNQASSNFHEEFLANKAEVKRLKDETEILMKNDKDKSKNIHLLSRQLEQVQGERSNLESQLQALKAEYETFKNKHTMEFDTDKNSKRTKEIETQTDVEDAQNQDVWEPNKSQADIADATKIRTEYEAILHDKEQELIALQEASLDTNRQHGDLLAKVKEQIKVSNDLEDENRKLTSSLEEISREKQTLAEDMLKTKQALQEDITILNQELETTREHLSLTAKNLENIQSEDEVLKMVLDKAITMDSDYFRIISGFSDGGLEIQDIRLDHVFSALKKLDNEYRHLRSEIEAKEIEADEKLQSEIAALKDLLNEQRNEETTKLQAAEEQLLATADELNDLRECNKILQEKQMEDSRRFEAELDAVKMKYEGNAKEDSDQCKSQISDASSGGSDFEIVAKDDDSDQSSSSKEFVQVEGNDEASLLRQKDDEIKILHEKVLLMSQQLLDCQSPTGDDVPPTLEEDVKLLKYEKEQMMAVMNDKMRECSSLKGEVHRLMNVVSAEKQAIEKLQHDNDDLAKKQQNAEDHELTKETIQKLSRLIRDKDMEMEALVEKNDSLLSALQNPSNSSDQIESLIQERENLQMQVNAYKNDREQILSALNQKHQESLKFHSELQKAQKNLFDESQTLKELQAQHSTIVEQYETKQKSLIDTQNELIVLKQKYSSLEQERAKLNQPDEEHRRLKQSHDDLDKLIGEKDLLILEKAKKIKEFEDILEKKDREISLLNVHAGSVDLQLKDKLDEFNEIGKQNSDLQGECAMLKDFNGKLNIALKEKDFELESLQSKISSLNCLLEKQATPGKEEEQDQKMVQLIEENGMISQRAQALQHERDQTIMAFNQCQQENKELQKHISWCEDKEARLTKDLERLRAHLVKIEESYTNEAIHAEEREKELRNRLTMAEERIMSSASSYTSANQQATLQVESLQEQLQMLATQRDDAIMQLANAESQVQHYSSSVNNLQLVLDQFQQEKERDIESLKKKFERQINDEKSNTSDMAKEVDLREKRLNEAMEALSAASRISEQLDRKEQLISTLKAEVSRKEHDLQVALQEMQNFASNNGGKVDKQVMKSLVLGYFSTPDDKKPEVMRLLAGVLDFNQEEVQKVKIFKDGQGKRVGWLSWLSQREANSSQHSATSSTDESSNKNSFSEAFVQFLQKESQPQVQVKLPAEEMAKELTMKTNEPAHAKPRRINPFTASVSPPSPTDKSAPPSHLLMKPVYSTIPTFTPMPVTDSNPTSSSSILKDVLKDE